MQGLLRSSRLCLSASPQGLGPSSKNFFSRLRFGNPFADDYPAWIWKGLKNSRRDKDIFAPFFRLINATKSAPTHTNSSSSSSRSRLQLSRICGERRSSDSRLPLLQRRCRYTAAPCVFPLLSLSLVALGFC